MVSDMIKTCWKKAYQTIQKAKYLSYKLSVQNQNPYNTSETN